MALEWVYQKSILVALAIALLYSLISFLQKGRKARSFYKTVPCPPHSMFWGHLKLIGEALTELPPGFHPQAMMLYIGKKYHMPPVFYLDMWPVSYPMLLIADPGVATQITQTKSLPKHPVNSLYISPLIGHTAVVIAEGAEWKRIRSIINPGFSPQYLATLTPILTKYVARFTAKLSQAADSGKVILLQEYLLKLTFDVIAEVVLGVDLDSQRKYNELAYHFGQATRHSTISSTSANLPMKYYLRFMQRYHARQQSRIIADLVRQRWSSQSSHPTTDKATPRAAVDLFLEAYKADEAHKSSLPAYLDEFFMTILIDNTKTLLLGGHDTTSSSLSWTIALLSLNPAALTALRSEHTSILGPNPSNSNPQLTTTPTLLNLLPYTTACIKEATRMFSPASTTRYSDPRNASLPTHITFNNQSLPLSGQQAWVNHYAIGQRSDLWRNPTSFLPERHMPDPPHAYPKDAWRIFEKGPRACVGMELAMNEMRVVLVEIARRFEFEVAYAESAPCAPGGDRGEWGGKMYQVIEFAAKPAGHMPVKVRRRVVNVEGEVGEGR